MSWSKALKASIKPQLSFARPKITPEAVDWDRVVTVDFETYYDAHYTLKKLSTSEYVRNDQFKVQMVGIKIGRKPTKVYDAKKGAAALKRINWSTHSLLCHNTAFDGFIMSHHYGIVPHRYYDTLSMARGLHSNEIGGGLDEVAKFYGGEGKIDGVLEHTKGVWDWPKEVFDFVVPYCVQDVDETFRIFEAMVPKMPADEMDLVGLTIRMFCDPVLRVDIPRVEAEYAREIEKRERLFFEAVPPWDYDEGGKHHDPEFFKKRVLKTKVERALEGAERHMLICKRLLGNNEFFADLLRAEGIEPPTKVSKAYIAKTPEEKEEVDEDDKYGYAFAKDDLEFTSLPDKVELWCGKLNPNRKADIPKIVAKQERIRSLVEARLAVKSQGNITRAERFLEAGKDDMPLPVGYAYYRAHTGRWGGNNKMNMQNLTRGGELRLSILAPPDHQMAVADSGQIEARVNAWLWGQEDLLDAFRKADTWDKSKGVARGEDRDAYCRFADDVYGREITTDDKMERFVGKVCIAEGELVLTHRGLTPINLISKEDWLWDGVEWVQHGGVVDQGIQEVITYDGLTATPDHEVFTEDGRIISLRQAASEMARLQNTGAGRKNLRFCDDRVVADTPRKRLSVRQGQMRPDWYYKADVSQQLEEWQNDVVLEERTQTSAPCRSAGEEIRRDFGSMHQLGKCAVEELRWPRNQVPIQDAHGVHSVGERELTSQRLRPRGDRPNQQRRALCAGESEASYQNATKPEQAQHADDSLAGKASFDSRISESVQPQLDISAHAQGSDRRANYRKVRVYDIVNAGPRKRFTVSNVLVLNCVLGLGFQMGAPKFQMTLAKGALGGPPVFFSTDECHRIVNTYRRRNHKIRDGWGICTRIIEDMAAGRTGAHKCINWEKETIWLPNGMSLKYPDLKSAVNKETGYVEYSYRSGDMRSKIYGGLLCENIVQALARIIVATQMLAISKRYRVVMTTHDEVVALPKTREAQKCFDYMIRCMTTAPAWCADIPLAAEGGFASNYSK